MKHYIHILTLALVTVGLGLAMCAEAAPAPKKKTVSSPQKKKDKAWYTQGPDLHFISMWGGAGYSGLVGNYKSANFGAEGSTYGVGSGMVGNFSQKFIGGGGGLIGFGYELHHNDFIFSVGPELRLFSSRNNINYRFDKVRDDYSSITQTYQFDDLSETQTVGQVMVPILFGGNFERYYFLAGAKVGYSFLGNYKQRGSLNTQVKEEAAIDDWINQSSHQWVADDMTKHPLYKDGAKGKNKWGVDVTLSAEFGINLNEFFSDQWNKQNEASAHPWRMRVGAFIDYGMPMLSSSNKTSGTLLADVPTINELGGVANPGYMTTRSLHQTDFANKKLSSLLVGVKFTALFQLNKIKKPNPRIVFVATDVDGNPLKTVAQVTIKNEDKPKQKPKVRSLGKKNTSTARYPRANYMMLAQAVGYLPSNFAGDTLRIEHDVDMDTVCFRLIPQPRLVCYVHDAESEIQIAGQVAFKSRNAEGHNQQTTTAVDNPSVVSLHYGDNFDVEVSAAGYHPTTGFVSKLTDTVHYYLKPIHRVRHVLLLKHMYFATDKTEILPMSDEDLNTLYNFLTENPKIRVLITGHTDSQGSVAHNQVLSEGRSASVKKAMVDKGIDPARIETDGKGESEPIDTNDTEAGRQNNRRVQVTVLNADEAEEDVW